MICVLLAMRLVPQLLAIPQSIPCSVSWLGQISVTYSTYCLVLLGLFCKNVVTLFILWSVSLFIYIMSSIVKLPTISRVLSTIQLDSTRIFASEYCYCIIIIFSLFWWKILALKRGQFKSTNIGTFFSGLNQYSSTISLLSYCTEFFYFLFYTELQKFHRNTVVYRNNGRK